MEPRAHCLYPHPRKCFWLWNLLLHCGLPLRWQDVVLVRPAVAPAAARRPLSLDLLRGSDSPLRLEQPAVAGQPAGASGYLATRALATGKRPAGGRKPEAGGEASRGLVCARTLIQKFISEDRLPHLLLYGPPGTGKTSTILACAKQLYKDKEFGSMVLEGRRNDLVSSKRINQDGPRDVGVLGKGFKLVILDEADAMTQDAQNALRRVIEKFTENTRFCLICNYLSKIIPALQSRCTRFRFGPLTPELMVPRLEHVVQEENVDISEDGMKALITLSSGDMRRALNILQSTNMAFGKVTEETVYTCTGHPLKTDIANILDWMLNQDFTTAYRHIMELKTLKGLALHDILTEVHLFVHRVDFPSSVRIHLLTKMADIEYRLSVGTSEKIQLSSLIAAFQVTRDLIVSEA
ncbi:Replication factor C subunit 5 [Cricetulus griseus]|uniref:Activator 1 subunit 5 n=1 Tax=Cricetulus griseus TaxID=10029 RepID=G3GU57_CRIGR|nr:Replication factor C subunit 5 [Cricetulus griseus]